MSDMADVGARLLTEYPELDIGVDFRFKDDTGEILDWNESILGPRPESNNISEVEAQTEHLEVEVLKNEKKQEIAAAAIEEIGGVYTPGIDGKDELQYELTKAILAIGQALGITSISENVKLQEVVRCGDKATQKQVLIDGATTTEEVESIGWVDG